jgi:hypothetical protein
MSAFGVRLTRPQKTLLRWLWIAREYSRLVSGGELRAARSLESLGLATCEWRDEAWFATVTPKGSGAVS